MKIPFSQNKLILKDRLFSILHHSLRILPGIGAFVAIAVLELHFMAYLLVLLAKWRIWTPRWRLLLSNLQINIVDILVVLSIVYFMASPGLFLWQQLLWLGVYLLWTLVLKSKAHKYGHMLQALSAQALSSTIIIYNLHYLGMVAALLGIWLVAFFSARHIFNSFETKRYHRSLVVIWSLFSLQLAWVLFHWQINLWVIPQYVFLQTLILATAIVLYILNEAGQLSDFLKKQVIFSILFVLLATLTISSLHHFI